MTAVTTSRGLELLQAARRGGYALAAFNAVNLETAQAIVRAAEYQRAPVILQISQNAARYGGLTELAQIGRVLREQASVPVMLHLDHAEDEAIARQALGLGFDGVMFEGDDPATMRRLAKMAHAHGSFFEAEYEVVGKGEREANQHDDLSDLSEFAQASGCDLLAVNIGTQHKQEDKSAHLDFRRLAKIASMTNLPLVLHGSSGVSDEQLARAAQEGISKVNIATDLTLTFTHAVQQSLDAGAKDLRKYLGAGRDAMQGRAEHYLRVLGSAGKA